MILFNRIKEIYSNSIGKTLARFANVYPIPIRVLKIGAVFIAFIFSGLFIAYLLIISGVFGFMPNQHDLKDVKNYTASEIYSADSVLIGKYFIENRTNATYDQLPLYLINALIATEDARFYEHRGIDFFSFLRVMVFSILLNDESSGGGSTISQQLAKNLFPRRDISFLSMPVNKMREMIIAGMLERIYAKDEILTLYLNTVPFGENCFGIEAGARRFFNKTPIELNVEESAVLVGLLKANTTYNPRLHPERSKSRRNIVISLMETEGYLDKPVSDSLKLLPLILDYNNDTQVDGTAAYFKEYLRNYLVKWCKENPMPDGTTLNIYTDGLKIYTTLHSKLQLFAEEAMNEHMQFLQSQFFKHWGNNYPWGKSNRVVNDAIRRSDRFAQMHAGGFSDEEILDFFNSEKIETTIFSWNGKIDTVITPKDSVINSLRYLRSGFIAMEPASGYVRAWIGGIDFSTYKYDHVKAKRQVGSTFKPIVYAAAIENGMDPCTMIPNTLKTYPEYDNWQPQNSGDEYGGAYSMKGGLTFSVNTIAVEVAMQVGIDNVIALAKKMGITAKIPEVPSVALGVSDISLFEMVQAYSTIDNKGIWAEPVFITRIESAEGDTLFIQSKTNSKRAFSQQTSAFIIDMMQNVVNKGTASRLRGTYGLQMLLAGKTGTTQNNTDGWFIGFSPRLVAGVWVGGEDQTVRFKSTSLGQGASMALPVFGKFMQKVSRDPDTRFFTFGSFTSLPDSLKMQYDCPLWIPDSISVDSMGFFNRIFYNIRNTLNPDKMDSISEFNYPGAE